MQLFAFMLRLKKTRRQRDQTAASATEFVAQGASERHRGFVGTVDERSGPTAGRRSFGGRGLPSTGKAPSQESGTRANPDTGGSRSAAIDPETCAELELRHAGTRSARQLGVSRVHAHRGRESSGCEDTGAPGTSHWAGSDWEAAYRGVHPHLPPLHHASLSRQLHQPLPTDGSLLG